MPIVMDLGFGEDGDAGDRGTVSKQATQGHKVYPVSGPPEGKPYSCLSALIMVEPRVTRCADAIWRGGVYAVVCERS